MNYKASFRVAGGGTISMVMHDSNCMTQQNCGGPATQTTCASPRSIDLTGMPAVPTQSALTSMQQPYQQPDGYYPQWAFFNVTSVTSP